MEIRPTIMSKFNRTDYYPCYLWKLSYRRGLVEWGFVHVSPCYIIICIVAAFCVYVCGFMLILLCSHHTSIPYPMLNIIIIIIIKLHHEPHMKNHIYTRWGGGMYGKLGHGNESGHSTPRRVEALVGLTIVDIACGSRHTAVVTNKGCLYT